MHISLLHSPVKVNDVFALVLGDESATSCAFDDSDIGQDDSKQFSCQESEGTLLCPVVSYSDHPEGDNLSKLCDIMSMSHLLLCMTELIFLWWMLSSNTV